MNNHSCEVCEGTKKIYFYINEKIDIKISITIPAENKEEANTILKSITQDHTQWKRDCDIEYKIEQIVEERQKNRTLVGPMFG